MTKHYFKMPYIDPQAYGVVCITEAAIDIDTLTESHDFIQKYHKMGFHLSEWRRLWAGISDCHGRQCRYFIGEKKSMGQDNVYFFLLDGPSEDFLCSVADDFMEGFSLTEMDSDTDGEAEYRSLVEAAKKKSH